jgi:hypothetical protein
MGDCTFVIWFLGIFKTYMRILLISFLLLFWVATMHAQPSANPELVAFLKSHTAEKYPDRDFSGKFLYVSLGSQCMFLIENWEIRRDYIISGAKKGAGNQSGSEQTPTGLHAIGERFGDDVPLGGILKSRIFTGKTATIYTDPTDVPEDHVTTRILWLKGEESGINKGGKVDSHGRYIYIHGTPEEGLLGKPASHGCIRMKNAEVIELYDEVPSGTPVLILDQ